MHDLSKVPFNTSTLFLILSYDFFAYTKDPFKTLIELLFSFHSKFYYELFEEVYCSKVGEDFFEAMNEDLELVLMS